MATIQVLKSNKRGVKIYAKMDFCTPKEKRAQTDCTGDVSLTLVGVSINSMLVFGILNKNLR